MYPGTFVIVTLCVILKQIEGNVLADVCKPEYAEGLNAYYLNGMCYVFRHITQQWNTHSCACKNGVGIFTGGELFRDHFCDIILNLRSLTNMTTEHCLMIGLRQQTAYKSTRDQGWYWEDKSSGCQSGRPSVAFTNSIWQSGFLDGFRDATTDDCAMHCFNQSYFIDITCNAWGHSICQFDQAPCGPLAMFPPSRRNTWVISNNTVECVTGVVKRMCQSDGQWGSYDYSACKRPPSSDCTGNPYTECMDGMVCKADGKCGCSADDHYAYYNSTLATYDCTPCEDTTESPVATEGWTPVTQQSYSGKGATAGKVGTFKELQKPNVYFCQFECTKTYGCAALTFMQSTGTCLLHTNQVLTCREATIRNADAVFMMVV